MIQIKVIMVIGFCYGYHDNDTVFWHYLLSSLTWHFTGWFSRLPFVSRCCVSCDVLGLAAHMVNKSNKLVLVSSIFIVSRQIICKECQFILVHLRTTTSRGCEYTKTLTLVTVNYTSDFISIFFIMIRRK